MGKIKIDGCVCERCSHRWVSRNKEEPRVCPKCKSPYWDIPRKKRKSKREKLKIKKQKSKKKRG